MARRILISQRRRIAAMCARHYPDGNYMYYLTGLRPISKFWTSIVVLNRQADGGANLASGVERGAGDGHYRQRWTYPIT